MKGGRLEGEQVGGHRDVQDLTEGVPGHHLARDPLELIGPRVGQGDQSGGGGQGHQPRQDRAGAAAVAELEEAGQQLAAHQDLGGQAGAGEHLQARG